MDNKNSKQYSVAVVATMSAGKSTLLNALMTEDLLPTSNLACTSTIFTIVDDDNAEIFLGRHISGTQISSWEEIDKQKLVDWNNLHFDRIEIKGNLPVIVSSEKDIKMTFFDTPGPNNSTNMQHKKITGELIENQEYSCIVCVLNATTLAIDNEKELLVSLQNRQKKCGNFSIYFALNKIDELDIEQSEYPLETVSDMQSFLVQLGFRDPIIIPTSACLSMSIRNIQKTSTLLSKNALARLLPFVKKYTPGVPAYMCSLSKNKQKAIVNQISLLWDQRKFYRQCLHDEKKFRKTLLAIRAVPDQAKRQILIGNTFFQADFLRKIDLLCGTAFLEKSIELDMLKKLDSEPSLYALRKKVRAKSKLKKINAKKNTTETHNKGAE